MSTDLDTTIDLVADWTAPTVQTRASWSDPWTDRPYLYADRLGSSIGGSIGAGTFTYEAGEILRPDKASFADFDYLDIDRHWIRATWQPNSGPGDPPPEEGEPAPPPYPNRWTGIVVNDRRQLMGVDSAGTDMLAGNQVLTAVEAKWALTRTQLNRSLVVQDGTTGYWIDRALTFNDDVASNQGRGTGGPNRSAAKFGGVYGFAAYNTPAELWNAWDILEYLLQAFDVFDANGPTLRIAPEVQQEVLTWYTPRVVQCDGRTFAQLLDQIVAPRYGLTWSLEWRDTDELEIWIHSYLPAPVVLPSGLTVPGNQNLVTIDPDDSIDAVDTIEQYDSARRYESVIVQGARRRSKFTLSHQDGTLQPDWLAADEFDYVLAASAAQGGDPNYSNLTYEQKQQANDAYRATPRLAKVYTRFVPPDDWDGKVGGGFGNVPANQREHIFPELDEDGQPVADTNIGWFLGGMRFLSYLIETPFVKPERMAGWVQTHAAATTGTDRWALLNRLSALAESETIYLGNNEINGYSFTASPKPLEDSPGVDLNPSTYSHMLGGLEFRNQVPAFPFKLSEVDWRDVAVTVAVEADARIEAQHPEPADPAANNQDSALIIRLGDRARHDLVIKNTITDVDAAGQLVRQLATVPLRNDLAWMRDLARMAWEWHQTPRHAFRLGYRQITGLFYLGDLITQVGTGGRARTANSLVTQVDWDFRRFRTTVRTEFAEALDITGLASMR